MKNNEGKIVANLPLPSFVNKGRKAFLFIYPYSMNKIQLMTYLNHNEIRFCYGCGSSYEANDFHEYQEEHCCDTAVKTEFDNPITLIVIPPPEPIVKDLRFLNKNTTAICELCGEVFTREQENDYYHHTTFGDGCTGDKRSIFQNVYKLEPNWDYHMIPCRLGYPPIVEDKPPKPPRKKPVRRPKKTDIDKVEKPPRKKPVGRPKKTDTAFNEPIDN